MTRHYIFAASSACARTPQRDPRTVAAIPESPEVPGSTARNKGGAVGDVESLCWVLALLLVLGLGAGLVAFAGIVVSLGGGR